MISNRPSPNQALHRRLTVTLAASSATLPPTVQPARQPPPSLSLGALIWLCLSTKGKAHLPTFFVVVFIVC